MMLQWHIAWLTPRIQLGGFVGGRLLTVPSSLSCSDSPLSSTWWSTNIYSEPFGTTTVCNCRRTEVIHNSANSSQAPILSTLLNFIFESDSTHNSALWNEPSEFIPITRMLLDLREHLGVGGMIHSTNLYCSGNTTVQLQKVVWQHQCWQVD